MQRTPPDELSISAPGRVCLFGEHQDYLGLPVIAAAIDLRIGVRAKARADGLLALDLPDIGESVTLDPSVDQQYSHHRDYLRSAVNVLLREGYRWSRGYDVTLRSAIPINAGVSSSSAMVVMWLGFLCAIGGRLDSTQTGPPSADQLARWGYAAEVLEFQDAGGMMDHYCAALGGVLAIDTRPPFFAEPLAAQLDGLILGNSQEPKATLEMLAARRADVADGCRMMQDRMPGFDLRSTPLFDAEECLAGLPASPARRLRANLVNRDLTVVAREALVANDAAEVGRLLTLHHAQLRDGLDLSTPKIERMLGAALEAGALGGKINGSGGGGCMFAFAPGREPQVSAAIERAGGKAYHVRVARGVDRDGEHAGWTGQEWD